MKYIYKILFIILAMVCINANAAYLTFVPRTLLQPNGDTLHCYISGDEFYCWLHDAQEYTIVQDPATGYFVYAALRDGRLVPTSWVAGTCDPAAKGLRPNARISAKEYNRLRNTMLQPAQRTVYRDEHTNKGTINNLVVFIRFADDTLFANSFNDVNRMFNDSSDNYRANSMFDYFKTASYNQLFIRTTFCPAPQGDQIISYQDTMPRAYFMPYSETNPTGYHENDSVHERVEREQNLLARAIEYIQDMVPADLNLDYNNDGFVDNVCFVVKGDVGDWSTLLWPHRWSLYLQAAYIHGKRVFDFNFQLADAGHYFTTSVMCHEMFHSLGAPDLYHYDDSTDLDAVGSWDLMGQNQNPPQQTCAYMKYKYGNWIRADEIIEISDFGTYTIMPLNSPTPDRVCYRVRTQDPREFILLDFRNQQTPFDEEVPGRGIVFYRINSRYHGNADYNGNDVLDEVYVFRKNGTPTSNGLVDYANFRGNIAARRNFSPTTNPYPFLSNGEAVAVQFGNLSSGTDSMTFDFMQYVGIEDVEASGYRLRPNPASDYVVVTAPSETPHCYQIYNVFGQLVAQHNGNETECVIATSSLPCGCYWIKIIENHKVIETLKFIKSK